MAVEWFMVQKSVTVVPASALYFLALGVACACTPVQWFEVRTGKGRAELILICPAVDGALVTPMVCLT